MKPLKTSRQIGEKIKERRKKLGITQEKLAEKLDVSYQQVQRYEKGANTLNAEKLQIVAECLNVPVGFFFEKEESMRGAPCLPPDEKKVLSLFRKINEKDRKTILLIMEIAARERS